MQKVELDGMDFYTYFKSGAEVVKRNKDDLNRINVFPVKDGDTGTNLAITMNSIAEETIVSKDFNIVINSMSNAAFENARGNSGIIFASFLGGFQHACGHLKSLTMEQFSQGATLAVNEAYSAVSMPVEGTMLTVIRAWSEYIEKTHKSHLHFSDLFEGAYLKAKQVLEETPELLEILKRNKVVDSGAKGFVMFLEGFNKFFDDIIHKSSDLERAEVEPLSSHDFEVPNYRYCTEVLLYESILKKPMIENLIADLGDSGIVTGNENMMKIHIHTNTPDELTKRFIQNGYKVNKSKVEDMMIQAEVERQRKSRIAIMTDSIADLTEEQILREQIHVLPLSLIADESVYLDKLTATKDNIQAILDYSKVYPTSSQPEVKQARLKLEWLLDLYDHIIIISVAKALSGTYSTYERTIAEFGDDSSRITLVDSKLNSGAQGLIVLDAVKMANRGESLMNIMNKINEGISKTSIYVSLDTFKYAVQSGRVPNEIGTVLVKLGAKPIMSLNEEGHGTAFGLAFSRKSIDKKIIKHVKKIIKVEGIDQYAIVHANNPELADRYRRIFEELIGKSPAITTEISAITTIHAGIGAVAIALTRR